MFSNLLRSWGGNKLGYVDKYKKLVQLNRNEGEERVGNEAREEPEPW